MTNQRDLMNKASEEYGVGGNSDFFTFDKSGNYKLRLLTPAYPIATHFFGKGVPAKVCYGADKGCPFHGDNAPKNDEGNEAKPSVKFIAYAIDRTDNKIKLAELPWSVVSQVTTYQEDEDYAFEEFPMPYDIKVTVDKEASAANIYKTLPAQSRSEIEPELLAEFENKNKDRSPEVYIEQRKEKQRTKDGNDDSLKAPAKQNQNEYPNEEINPKDIPF